MSFHLVTEYTATMLKMVVSIVSGDVESQITMPVAPPPLCHNADRPELSQAIARHVSRFNK